MSTANFLQGLLLLQLHCTDIQGEYLQLRGGEAVHLPVDIPLKKFEVVALEEMGWFKEFNGRWSAELPHLD